MWPLAAWLRQQALCCSAHEHCAFEIIQFHKRRCHHFPASGTSERGFQAPSARASAPAAARAVAVFNSKPLWHHGSAAFIRRAALPLRAEADLRSLRTEDLFSCRRGRIPAFPDALRVLQRQEEKKLLSCAQKTRMQNGLAISVCATASLRAAGAEPGCFGGCLSRRPSPRNAVVTGSRDHYT